MSRPALYIFVPLMLALGTAVNLPASEALLRAAAESNINQQYTIESVLIGGVAIDHLHQSKLPASLSHRLAGLIGEPCDMAAIAELAGAMRSELHLQSVSERLTRGSAPDRIIVNFETVRRTAAVEISVPRFLYHSTQGWTGELDATGRLGQNVLYFGLTSDGDDLTERFSGFRARLERPALHSDKIHFVMTFEDYGEQWTPATREAVDRLPGGASNGFDLYRQRRNLAPQVVFTLNRLVTVSAGASFEQLDSDAPGAWSRAANAETAEVRIGRTAGTESDAEDMEVKYIVRSGLSGLGSDYDYTRQEIATRYGWRSGRNSVSFEFRAGAIWGAAPSYERFVLGSSSTLRGWDRYAINPLGGNRMVHNSVRLGRRIGQGTAEIIYDSGALWDNGGPVELRHSIAFGYRQGIFNVAMAIPVGEGRMPPVFMSGMNY